MDNGGRAAAVSSGADNADRGLSRRRFLRLCAYGGCALYVYGLGGLLACAPRAIADDPPPAAATAVKGFVRPVRSSWYTSLGGGRVRCELCPRQCELAGGERGQCRVRESRQGALYTLAHGNPALVQEDPIERKPFFHVLPGSRALSISTAGCNLACEFCEVWDMALVRPEEVHAYDMPPPAVVSHAIATGVRSVGHAFGEPVVSYEYVMDVADRAREAGLLNLLHTAAYIQPEPLRQLCTRVDAVNVDLKGFDPEFYRRVVGGELAPVLDSLQLLRGAGVHLEITTIVIPTLNDDLAMIERMCRWIVDELGPDVPLHLARFYPLYKLAALPRTPVTTLDAARRTALDAGLNYVYVAKVTGHEGENTICPACARIVIRRVGFVVAEMRLTRGACDFCGAALPGIWE